MIETHDLTKRYGEVLALDRLNLKVGKGEIFGYIGPNGAGKTTTIKILVGLLKATSGKATVAGLEVARAKPDDLKRLVGYMPDWFGVYRQMRVWEYLDFFGAAFRMRKKARAARIDAALDITGTTAMRDYFVDTLSRGMTQRVGIARLLMHDPQVLFLDEPASGLDPRARVQMRELLRKLRGMGKTILLSSHILPELAGVCDRIGILEKATLLAQGTVQEVMRSVRPKRVLEVETTTVSATSAVREALVALGGERVRIREVDDEMVRFEFDGDDDQVAELWNGLASRGCRFVACREVLGDLEDVYLSITRQEAAGARAGQT